MASVRSVSLFSPVNIPELLVREMRELLISFLPSHVEMMTLS